MSLSIHFEEDRLNRLFPFYILINRDLSIGAMGSSIEKMCQLKKGDSFKDIFIIPRPFTEVEAFDQLVHIQNQHVLLESKHEQHKKLRGQFEYLEDAQQVLFVGSPWVSSMDQVKEFNLQIKDFAYHDALIDLLHVLKTRDITNEDLKQLVYSFNAQKQELKKATKLYQDIALFPTQNPDPLIRINFEGEVLLNNPAAAHMDFFEYKGKRIRNDEFFKLISEQIDKENPRWKIEAVSDGRIYSFVCITMKEVGYINIYGREITKEKANEEKLKVLSLIAEDNINAVIIADKEGRITWANKSFTQMTGYSLEEVLGKKPGSFLQGPETDSQTIQYLRDKIHSGEHFNAQIVNYSKTGKKYWLKIQGQPIKDINGEITGYFAIEEDITKEVESDRIFKKALESIGDNVWEHDFITEKTYFSKENNYFLGFNNSEFTSNQELWWNNVYPEDKNLLIENDQKYREGSLDSHSLEYRIKHKDGSLRWILDRGVVIERDINGKPLRIIGTHTDITEIKFIETELANRVKQFQSLSENVPGVMYEYAFKKDGNQGFIYISPGIEKVFGIKPTEIKHYLDFVHEDDRQMIIDKYQHCKKTLEPFYAEARFVVAGQPLRWHSVHSSYSYQTEQGDHVYTGFFLDITKQKNAQQILDEQRQFYENILNHIPADVAVFSPSHEYLFVNPKGIKDPHLRNWIIGKRDEDYCVYRNKPLSIAEDRRKLFLEVIDSKKAKEWEEKNIDNNGKDTYVLRRWFPVLDDNNQVTFVIGYGIDITERKKFEVVLQANEEKYRNIIANMNLGLMEVDNDGLIDFANQTLLKMIGLNENDVLGYDSKKLLTSESVKFYRSSNNQQGAKTDAYEIKLNINEKECWWFVSSAPKIDSNGNRNGSIVICLDITHQKALENDLITAREQAEYLAKVKETFLANMSHEIRTPMNAIIGMGNQLSKTQLSEQQTLYLNSIKTASDNLLVIINDILDLSKIEAGKLSIEKIPFVLNKVIKNALQVLTYKAEEKGLVITNSFFDTKIADVLIGDPYRLTQVLLNLIGNGIKFTEHGSIDISCTIISEKGNKQTIRTNITDTGIGMDQEFIKHLFDKFSQEYESVTRMYGGTGLGMSITKDLVTLMGGIISVQSEKGKGTNIQFDIEFEIGKIEDLPKEKEVEIDVKKLSGKKILVVDDNEMNRLVASIMLENLDAIISEASNGFDAITLVKNETFDLVLMDIQMPKLNGYDATKQIRELGFQIPIIALTANAISGERKKCLDAGMNDYVTKPFTEDEFVQTVKKWINVSNESPILQEQAIHTTLPTDKRYDLSNLKEISQNNDAFVRKMIGLFIQQAPSTMKEMNLAYQAGDYKKISKLAHRIKPSIDSLRILNIYDDIREIEIDATTYGQSTKLETLLKKVDTELRFVVSELASIMNA